MEILGIGLPELGFIILIALIVLGPKDMVAAGRTLGKSLRKLVTSPTWKAVRTAGQELQQVPTRLMREAGLDELQDIKEDIEEDLEDASHSIDPRRIAHDLRENQPPGEPSPPAPAHSTEADSSSKPDRSPEPSSEKPQT